MALSKIAYNGLSAEEAMSAKEGRDDRFVGTIFLCAQIPRKYLEAGGGRSWGQWKAKIDGQYSSVGAKNEYCPSSVIF